MYFGGTIMTFALPYGAFIVISIVLFFLFRARHSGPRLKYLHTEGFTSVGTREPGPAPAPSVAGAGAEETAEVKSETKAEAKTEPAAAEAADTTESKDGGE